MTNYTDEDRAEEKKRSENAKEFGRKLKTARERKGLTQPELAEKIGKQNGQTISNWETGSYPPKSFADAIRLSEVLDVDLDYLTGRIREQTHDIQFIHDQTGLTGDAVKKLQGNSGLMFVLSLLIEQKDFDLWLHRINGYFNDILANHKFPPATEEDIEDEIDDRDQKGVLIYTSLLRILDAVPIREYEIRLNDALKNVHWKGDDMD